MGKIDFAKYSKYDVVSFEDYGMMYVASDDEAYIVLPDGNYGYNIKNIVTGEVVVNPDEEQLMFGLLNLLAFDNQHNSLKRGHYRLNVEKLYYGFMDDMTNLMISKRNETADDFICDWAISGEIKEMAVRGAFNDLAKVAEEERVF